MYKVGDRVKVVSTAATTDVWEIEGVNPNNFIYTGWLVDPITGTLPKGTLFYFRAQDIVLASTIKPHKFKVGEIVKVKSQVNREFIVESHLPSKASPQLPYYCIKENVTNGNFFYAYEDEFDRLIDEFDKAKTKEIKIPKCVVVRNTVANKEFFYCRTHDEEAQNLYCCPKG